MLNFAKTLHIQYYAALREQRGLSQEQYVTGAAASASELYQELAKRFSLLVHPQLLRLAINDQFAAWDSPLQEGDKVIFIPPVAGG